MIAGGLAVPPRHPREPLSDVGYLDVEGRGVEQIEPPAGQHALPGTRRRSRSVRHQASSAGGSCGKVKRAQAGMASASVALPAVIGRPLSMAALTLSMRAIAIACGSGARSKRADRPPAGQDVGSGRGQGALGGRDQHAAARRSAMLHARDHFLSDIAALPEADAAGLVEQHVMRKCLAERIVAAAFGDAVGDAEGMPGGGFSVRRLSRRVVAPNPRRARQTAGRAARPASVESEFEAPESACQAMRTGF